MNKTIDFIKTKVRILPFSCLPTGKYRVFGSGGGAHQVRLKLEDNPGTDFIGFMEHSAKTGQKDAQQCMDAAAATGRVILGTQTTEFQFNQIKALLKNAEKIEQVYILDDFADARRPENSKKKSETAILGWHSTVSAQQPISQALQKHLQAAGWDLYQLSALDLGTLSTMKRLQHVFIWNGQRDFFQPALSYLAARNIPVTYMEAGFFPQDQHFYLDRYGVNQKCRLMSDDLGWVGEKHLERIRTTRDNFFGNISLLNEDYVLIPLQVPTDANIVYCSRFTSGMQEFIDYICDIYEGKERLVFKVHPKDPYNGQYRFYGHETSDANFAELLSRAKKVHGITSSTLYEAALAGIETISEGESLLNRHSHQVKKLLAAMIDRQAHVNETDLSYWLRTYSNFAFDDRKSKRCPRWSE